MAESPSSLLDPVAIAKGEALGVIAREIVEGYRVGEHRSPFHGFAIEFAQHREYTTGDDLRHLDWKVLGRTDRYYIKQYEQDTNFVAHLLLDGSESMNYGSGARTKLDYAKTLAACLALLVLRQSDAIGLNVFDTEIRERFARTDNPGKIHEIMHRLGAFEARAGTSIGRALRIWRGVCGGAASSWSSAIFSTTRRSSRRGWRDCASRAAKSLFSMCWIPTRSSFRSQGQCASSASKRDL